MRKSFTASQVPQIYKLNEGRLALIKDSYGAKSDSFKCTFTKVWSEIRVKKERVREYTRTVVKWTEGVGQGDLLAEIMGLNCVTFKKKRTERIQDVFVDKLTIKQFESDWMCMGIEDVPF